MSREAFETLPLSEQEVACRRVEEAFRAAGADFVLRTIRELPPLVRVLWARERH